MGPSTSPQTLSFPVPSHPHLLFLAHLTLLSSTSTTTTTTILHLTTTPLSSPSTTSPLGSFVYALPDRLSPNTNTISTPLTTSPNTIEYATRLAKILARKLNGPVYVGCSIEVEGMTVEEEMEGLREVVGRVVDAVNRERGEASS